FLLTVSKQVQERHASNVVRTFPMVQTLHLWSVNPSAEAFYFILSLCRSMGEKLVTLNLWIEQLDMRRLTRGNIAQLYETINTQMPNLRHLTLCIYLDYRFQPNPQDQIDMPILAQLE